MVDLLGHSITYRVAIGPRAGQKVFTLQTVPQRDAEPRTGVAQYAGFSLHAGIGIEAGQRAKLAGRANKRRGPGRTPSLFLHAN
jgi:hypothetical protein